jgi:uncharacterized protein (DUF952 family)
MNDAITHISTKADWTNAQRIGEYRAESLENEGFIHCSRPEQLLTVANQYYLNRTDLVLIWLDPQKLVSKLVWENSDGDNFPHLYGPLNFDAVIAVVDFTPNSNGYFVEVPLPQK